MYITDCLYSFYTFTGNNPGVRYYDILHPTKEVRRETAQETAHERLARFGIEVVD